MKIYKLLLIILFVEQLFSLPRYAIVRGGKCSDCHFNPTGGLLRNEDGFNWAKNNLGLMKTKGSVSQNLNENVVFGLDFRFQYLYSQELNKADFHKMAGGIYLGINLDEDIKFLTKYDIYRGYFEAYGILLNLLPFDGYIKIGTFLPDFGIRIDDHTSYTRGGDGGLLSKKNSQGLVFEPGYSQTGVELKFEPLDQVSFTFSVGQDKTPFMRDPSYISKIEFNPSITEFNILVGTSYGSFQKISTPYRLVSVFGGFGIHRFSLLSEIVFAQNFFNVDQNSRAFMTELAYRIKTGFDVISRIDYSVPDLKENNQYFSHLILGLDVSPYPFIKLKPQVRFNLEKPLEKNNNSFVLQFHFWY